MLNFEQIESILRRISYKDWEFMLVARSDETIYLQIAFSAQDNVTKEQTHWTGRKWLLSYHMTPSEIVLTALKAVLTAEEHEAREQFKLDGVAPFDPHMNVGKLLELAQTEDHLEVRDTPTA